MYAPRTRFILIETSHAGNVGAFQNSFAVYGRSGQACRACGRALEKIKVAGRATVYCPHCQK